MKTNESKNKSVISEINVTPFVDVMLVLLIIFMVTAPMLQQGLNISLPNVKSSGVTPSPNPFIVQIQKSKKIYIGTSQISLQKLESKLESIFKNRKDKQVYIQADKTVPYGLVAKVLAEIKSSGINNISLVTLSQ